MVLNSTVYNQETYNRALWFIAWASTDDIIFNWLWLQNLNIVTSFKNDDNLPNIDLNTYQNPIIDWWWVLNRRYTDKKIVLKWFIKSSNKLELNNLIDLFKTKTSVIEWFLDIKVNWFYRRTRATVVSNNILDRKHYNITAVPFEITFESLAPFFYHIEDVTILEAGVVGNKSVWFTYFGTAPSQPVVYFVFTTGWGTNVIKFKLNDRILTLNKAINNDDILAFDSLTKTVLVNWIEVDYVGTFPQIKYWNNLFEFEINWTPLLDITILYSTNYL